MLRRALFMTLITSAGLGGCASMGAPACPVGQEPMRTAQLFFGQTGGAPGLSDRDFKAFLDAEVTPRFPQGLTVLDGGGQWKGDENHLIREATKVVVLVLPNGDDARGKVNDVRKAYTERFRQDSVMLVTQPACVAF